MKAKKVSTAPWSTRSIITSLTASPGGGVSNRSTLPQ
jgi:hypothetical protein